MTGGAVQFAPSTIERWYYLARRQNEDPVGALRRAVRKDCSQFSLPPALVARLFAQYRDHEHWTYQLHYDNLAAMVKADPTLGPLPSYSTVRRYMQAHGLIRKRRAAPKGRPGQERAARRRERREIRSYEAQYVGSLWHLDFHHGSLPVLLPSGQWHVPLALGILDDHSRLCCHLQWYLSETAEDLVHGLSQGGWKGTDARVPQRSESSLGRNGIPPDGASGNGQIPSRDRHFRELSVRYGMARELAQLDEKCFLEVFQPPSPRQASKKKARTGR